MSEGEPPQTADTAVRSFIGLFILMAVLHGGDIWGREPIQNSVTWWIIAAFMAVFDFYWLKIKTFFGPRFSATMISIATDARWWVGTILVLLLVVTLSPFVEQRRWPFSAFAPITADVPQAAAAVISPPTTQRAITELLNESGGLLDIIQNTGIPLANEWRSSITSQNPEKICLDLSSLSIQGQISDLIGKLRVAHDTMSSVLEKNRIDQAELTPLLGSVPGLIPMNFIQAGNILEQYRASIEQLGEHPTCDELIRTKNVPNTFLLMDRGLEAFSIWLALPSWSARNSR